MKHWYTTLFGILAGVSATAGTLGIHVGHIGNGDWLQLLGAIGIAGLGVSAADASKAELK